MNRRYFFRQLASGLVAASAPGLFLPKLIKPGWKRDPKYQACEFVTYEIKRPALMNYDVVTDPDSGFSLAMSHYSDGRIHIEPLFGTGAIRVWARKLPLIPK